MQPALVRVLRSSTLRANLAATDFVRSATVRSGEGQFYASDECRIGRNVYPYGR